MTKVKQTKAEERRLSVVKRWLNRRGLDLHVVDDAVYVYSMVNGAVLSPQGYAHFMSNYEDFGKGEIIKDRVGLIELAEEEVLNYDKWLCRMKAEGLVG